MFRNAYSAILAGFFITLGCVINLRNPGIAGASLFSIGLISVVHYKLKLYTGTAGFYSGGRLFYLISILIGNAIGAFLASICAPDVTEQASLVIATRLNQSPLQCLLYAIPCGAIMSVAVKYARQGRYLPLLFGVPAFILGGFYHSIADIGYFFLSDATFVTYTVTWLATVLGNFIGCNIAYLYNHDYAH